ncbi:MAG: hypothetical protein IJV69_06180 [Kiritimatiellae bacterium]|nr:hypothetical protein [Kiritimatiellia bacterium]
MANNAKTALLCAYTLAKAKQYAEAEALILSHDELSKTPEAIDLLARIRMEEGDLSEARRLWQGIQTVYPEHQPSRIALKLMGHRQIKVRWAMVWACLLPFAFIIGMLVALVTGLSSPVESVTILWDNIPTQAKVNALADYQGKVRRVYVASQFFSQPDKYISRAILTQMLAKRLDLPESAMFLGAATDDLSASAIRVELELL